MIYNLKVVTALLALISQQQQSSEVNASYVIAINVWMTVCIAFVFSALIEYAISIAYHEDKVDPIEVNNTKKKMNKFQAKLKKNEVNVLELVIYLMLSLSFIMLILMILVYFR